MGAASAVLFSAGQCAAPILCHARNYSAQWLYTMRPACRVARMARVHVDGRLRLSDDAVIVPLGTTPCGAFQEHARNHCAHRYYTMRPGCCVARMARGDVDGRLRLRDNAVIVPLGTTPAVPSSASTCATPIHSYLCNACSHW